MKIESGYNCDPTAIGTGPSVCTKITPTCTATVNHDHSACDSGDVYWFDNCNVRNDIKTDCTSTQTCSNGQCVHSM